MPSPFPGMNPYLEQDTAWQDFHQRFLPLAAEILASQVRPRYFVKIEEHLYVHEPRAEERRFIGRPDVAVVPASPSSVTQPGRALLEAPVQVRIPVLDVERSTYLEVRSRDRRELVTVIEMLSPTNKRPGRDRDQYEAKRNQVLWSCTNLVEIDLLRGYPRMAMAEAPECDYCVMVCRPEEWPQAGFWPIRLGDRLPIIPVPLRSGEPNAKLDLQELLHRVYDVADYQLYVYQGHPEPRLSAKDAAWARQWLPHTADSPEPTKRPRRKRS
jgi:Protein of unknown function (DUF4058)